MPTTAPTTKRKKRMTRTDYIMAKSLYIAYTLLDQEEDVRQRQDSDISDMLEILDHTYPHFLQVFRNFQERGIQI